MATDHDTDDGSSIGLHKSVNGGVLPGRTKDDWTDEELNDAARALDYKTLKQDYGGEVRGKRALTDDGREWLMSPYTVKCNDNGEVKINPPWNDSYEPTEAVALHPIHNWTPNPSTQLFAVPGRHVDRPYVLVCKRLTTGAWSRGYRVEYVGPYCGSRRDILPAGSRDDVDEVEVDQ